MKLDVGSGYHPAPGYYTADIGGSPSLDYHIIDGHIECPDALFEEVRARNVVHHIKEPASFFAELARVTQPGGTVVIIEPVPTRFEINRTLDILWYRYIYCRPEIFIANNPVEWLDKVPPSLLLYSHDADDHYSTFRFVKR